MLLDPQNIRLNTIIVELCALLAEIWRNIHFPVMASLICIKMVCGTFCQLFNIANRFLWYFSNLETSIRNWFPGGARYPLLPAQLIGRGLFQIQVVQSRRNNSFIVVFTLHSSKFLNVIHKNCKYMHVDKDIHRNSYTSLCISSLS